MSCEILIPLSLRIAFHNFAKSYRLKYVNAQHLIYLKQSKSRGYCCKRQIISITLQSYRLKYVNAQHLIYLQTVKK